MCVSCGGQGQPRVLPKPGARSVAVLWLPGAHQQGTIWKPNSFLGQEERAVAALMDPTLPLCAAIAALRPV